MLFIEKGHSIGPILAVQTKLGELLTLCLDYEGEEDMSKTQAVPQQIRKYSIHFLLNHKMIGKVQGKLG